MIRLAVADDIPQILINGRKFSEAAYPEFGYDEKSFRKCVDQMIADKLLFVAEENGAHIGGIGAILGRVFINESFVIAVERFWWIKPEHRAGGIGTELENALEVAARDAGCYCLDMIALHNRDFPLVDGFYKKLKFSPVEHVYRKVL